MAENKGFGKAHDLLVDGGGGWYARSYMVSPNEFAAVVQTVVPTLLLIEGLLVVGCSLHTERQHPAFPYLGYKEFFDVRNLSQKTEYIMKEGTQMQQKTKTMK